MFDCWILSREMDDFPTVASVYRHVAQVEMCYRGMKNPLEDVLLDTIKSCLCIMGRRGIRPEDYQYSANVYRERAKKEKREGAGNHEDPCLERKS